MKIAMHTWMRPEPAEVTIARLARCGYDAIQIGGEPSICDPGAIRALLRRYRLTCCGVATLMTAGRDFISPDPAVRQQTVQYLRDCLTLAHELGAELVCVVPATVGKTLPAADPEQEWDWAVEGLGRCAEWAERLEIVIGIEPINRFETYFINRADQALALAEAIGAAHVGVILDAFHMNIEETDLLGAIRRAGDRLVDFHAADNNRRPPGEGALDWAAIVATLSGMGYDGYLSGEFVLPLDGTPAGALASGPGGLIRTSSDAYLRVHASGDVGAAEYDRCVEQTIAHLRWALSCIPALRKAG